MDETEATTHVTEPALGLVDRRRTANVPWRAIQSAEVSRSRSGSVLRVTLRPEATVPPTTTLRPRTRAGQRVYTIDVGLLRPTPDVLRAALDRHLSGAAQHPSSAET